MLTQSRKHIIKKTFEALQGVKKAVVHLYNSTTLAQREQVFKKEKPEIIKIATDGAALMKEYAAKHPETKFSFEYSPESFTARKWILQQRYATLSSIYGSRRRTTRSS